MRWYTAAFFLIFFVTPASGNAATVIVGDCNQVNENVVLGEGATATFINDCPVSPEDSFTVSFYWLDSLTLSFLMAGYSDEHMKAVLNPRPIVVKNSVYSNIEDILRRFGERPVTLNYDENGQSQQKPSDPGFVRFGDYSQIVTGRKRVGDDGELVPISDAPTAVLKKLRIYDGDAKIIWPDLDAINSYFNTVRWPTEYQMSYWAQGDNLDVDLAADFRTKPNATARYIFECTTISKKIQKPEFIGYWDRLKTFVKMIKTSPGGSNLGAFQPGGDTRTTTPGSRSNINSYEAIKYYTRDNWPEDFLVATGRLYGDECGADAGFELVAIPRSLFALVAVIKPKSKSLRITGILYKEDPQEQLRSEVEPNIERAVDEELPLIDREQSFVVPLRLELRYKTDEYPVQKIVHPDPNGIFSKIKSIDAEQIVLDPKFYFKDNIAFDLGEVSSGSYSGGNEAAANLPVIRKDISTFLAPQSQKITQTYIYGRSLDLLAIRLKAGQIGVRKTPRYALLSEGGFDGASCPFLYFREADGQLSLNGRILVGATDAAKSRTDEALVPEGATSVVLMEKEPEITFVSRLEYRNGVDGHWTQIRDTFSIEPGGILEVQLPDAAEPGASIRVTGYYRTLNSFVSSSALDSRLVK